MDKWVPTHCLRGQSPYPVMLVSEIDGVVIYHDGFARTRMFADIFHRLHMPIEEYKVARKPTRPSAKSQGKKLLAALKTGGPLPNAEALANRGKKKAPRRPPGALDFFV